MDADDDPAAIADAFESAFEDPTVGAVVAATGGDQQVRVPPHSERDAYRDRQHDAVHETIRAFADVPIVFDFDVGHTDPHAPVPLGARVDLDPENKTVTFH
ncbi:hypothetical protein [Halorubellus salinus]|uniref:hypothetical protein n=1 Tax=Halorubellus salinus TaxID=755309 RepID=UPI0034A4FC0C